MKTNVAAETMKATTEINQDIARASVTKFTCPAGEYRTPKPQIQCPHCGVITSAIPPNVILPGEALRCQHCFAVYHYNPKSK